MSHYETLGVQPDATPEQIKAAYRVAASKAHPDKGGSDEAMKKVNRAYEVLSDPEARARYESTGQDEQPRGPSVHDTALRMMAEIFSATIEDEKLNLVSTARGAIEQAGAHADKAERAALRAIERLNRRRPRVRTKNGRENMVHQIIDGQLRGHASALEEVSFKRKVLALMSSMVDDYEDDTKEPDSEIFSSFVHTTRFTR